MRSPLVCLSPLTMPLSQFCLNSKWLRAARTAPGWAMSPWAVHHADKCPFPTSTAPHARMDPSPLLHYAVIPTSAACSSGFTLCSQCHAALPHPFGQWQKAAAGGGRGSPGPLAAVAAEAIEGAVAEQMPSVCNLMPCGLHVAHRQPVRQPYFSQCTFNHLQMEW